MVKLLSFSYMEKKLKPKKCKVCGEDFTPYRSTQKVCSPAHAIEYGIRQTAKREQKKVKEYKKELRAEKREAKEKLKTYSQRVNEVKVIFQRYIRIRDAKLPCISCGAVTSSVWDAGHYKKAELYSGVIFNELNTNKQCGKCNRYLGGNELNYRVGLINKIGIERVLELEKLAESTRVKKYSDLELLEIRTRFAHKIKSLTQ